MRAHKPLAAVAALLIAVAAVGGAVDLAQSEPVADVIEDTTGFDTATISPVGDAKALINAGLVIVMGGVAAACYTETVICQEDAPSKKKMKRVDALETKSSIHGQAAAIAQKNEELLAQYETWLESTRSEATWKGNAAYFAALNNGSSKGFARLQGYNAIENYYAAQQMRLIRAWRSTMLAADNMEATANETADLSASWPIRAVSSVSGSMDESGSSATITDQRVNVTLVNETTVQVPVIRVTVTGHDTYDNAHTFTHRIGYPKTGDYSKHYDYYQGGDMDGYSHVKGLYVPAPTSQFDRVRYVDFSTWSNQWHALEQQETQMKNRLENFVNATYSAYQSGELTVREMRAPLQYARQYSPRGSWGAYTLAKLINLGMAPPKSIQNVGSMTIRNQNETATGLLLSDGLPANATFEAGTTYNATALAGQQLLISPGQKQIWRVRGDFTVLNITSPDGKTLHSVTYRTIDRQYANLSDYKHTLQNRIELKEEIEARQKKMREKIDSGAGAIPTIPGLGLWGTLAVIGGALLLISLAS